MAPLYVCYTDPPISTGYWNVFAKHILWLTKASGSKRIKSILYSQCYHHDIIYWYQNTMIVLFDSKILCYGLIKPDENMVIMLYPLFMHSVHFEVKAADFLHCWGTICFHTFKKRIGLRLNGDFDKKNSFHSKPKHAIYIHFTSYTCFHGETLNVFIVKLINLTILILFVVNELVYRRVLSNFVDVSFNHPWDTHEASKGYTGSGLGSLLPWEYGEYIIFLHIEFSSLS